MRKTFILKWKKEKKTLLHKHLILLLFLSHETEQLSMKKRENREKFIFLQRFFFFVSCKTFKVVESFFSSLCVEPGNYTLVKKSCVHRSSDCDGVGLSRCLTLCIFPFLLLFCGVLFCVVSILSIIFGMEIKFNLRAMKFAGNLGLKNYFQAFKTRKSSEISAKNPLQNWVCRVRASPTQTIKCGFIFSCNIE